MIGTHKGTIILTTTHVKRQALVPVSAFFAALPHSGAFSSMRDLVTNNCSSFATRSQCLRGHAYFSEGLWRQVILVKYLQLAAACSTSNPHLLLKLGSITKNPGFRAPLWRKAYVSWEEQKLQAEHRFGVICPIILWCFPFFLYNPIQPLYNPSMSPI